MLFLFSVVGAGQSCRVDVVERDDRWVLEVSYERPDAEGVICLS
jgi:hypothetical protein